MKIHSDDGKSIFYDGCYALMQAMPVHKNVRDLFAGAGLNIFVDPVYLLADANAKNRGADSRTSANHVKTLFK